jgi:hypothetical protein
MNDDAPKPKLSKIELRDQHALLIGRIAMTWNILHENLATLFGALFEHKDLKLALASWHSQVNDAAQREMLRAVAETKFGPDAKAYEEINWILEKIKQQIANQRNIGIHMPVMFLTHVQSQEPAAMPLYFSGNRRANTMHGKDLLKEYQHYEGQIDKLNNYLLAIDWNLTHPTLQKPWPDRPRLQPHAPK